MRPLALLVALAVLAVPPFAGAGASLAASPSQEFLVGYKEGERDTALLAVRLAGGTSARTDDDLRVIVALADDPARFAAAVALAPSVEYVETNDATGLHGVDWNGADWNGADWNGVDWNGVDWNGAQFSGGGSSSDADPGRRFQWGLEAVGAPGAWSITTGARRATLCVLDTGLDASHRDLDAHALPGFNAIDGSADTRDDGAHGTHVAGIAAAEVGNAWGVAGVGNVRILPVKVLDANGRGDEGDLAFGIAWCARAGADVALMALGATPGPTLDRAIEFAASRDVLLVASAGNDAGAVGYPARDARVLAVSAITKNHTLAEFSNRGPEVDLAAPGVRIASAWPGDRFAYGTGTSQAVAFVAGAAALLRDRHPDWDAGATRARLEASADDVGASGRDPHYGAGLLDVKRALAG